MFEALVIACALCPVRKVWEDILGMVSIIQFT